MHRFLKSNKKINNNIKQRASLTNYEAKAIEDEVNTNSKSNGNEEKWRKYKCSA